MTAIEIPKNITSIKDYTFYGCTSLSTVEIPKNVTRIEDSAFKKCSNLKSIVIPKNVECIKNGAFSDCTNLKDVNILNSETSIWFGVFNNTAWLKSEQEKNPLVITNNILINAELCSGNIIIPENVVNIASAGCYSENIDSVTVLNPNCKISGSAISNVIGKAGYVFTGKIYGYKNSTAQNFAISQEKYGCTFIELKNLKGDANVDGEVNVADAVMLQKWLLGSGSLTNWKNVDLCEDGRIDVFDMVEMRKLIVKSK